MTSTGIHDIGGLEEEFGSIDLQEHGYQLWEMQVSSQVRKRMSSTCVISEIEITEILSFVAYFFFIIL